MEKIRAFTLKSKGILNMLKTETLILSDVRDMTKEYTPKMWSGLWDTGASRSSITKRIVDDLGLVPVGSINLSTANGIVRANTYFINMGLPNGVTIKNVLVSCADLGDDIDVLIGMDIIRHGDFSITNVNDKTTFSFRTPSLKQMAQLFQRDKSTISRHIKKIYEEGELIRISTVADFATVQMEGNREVEREV